jgi:hypothetical protein
MKTLDVMSDKMQEYPYVVYWISVFDGSVTDRGHTTSALKSDFSAFATYQEADKFKIKMEELKEIKATYRSRVVFQVSQIESIK